MSRLNKAHLLALAGNIATAIVTLVPAWSSEKQLIVAALGGVISNTYPLVSAVHALVGVVEKLLASRPTGAQLLANAESVVKAEISKVNFDALVKDAVNAKSLPDLAAQMDATARRVLADLLGQASTKAAAPANTVQTGTAAVPPTAG